MNPVKDQGACTHGGYAWAAVSLIEANFAHSWAYGVFKSGESWDWSSSVKSSNNYALIFSEQQVIDCTAKAIKAKDGKSYTNAKCVSGNVGAALAYFTRYDFSSTMTSTTQGNGAAALTLSTKYANVGSTVQNCKYKHTTSTYLHLNNDKVMAAGTTVANFKASLGTYMYATNIKSCADFKSYKGGIFSKIDCATVDHAVHIVGFDANSWIVKNSWGTTWGVKGFGNVLIKSDTGTYKTTRATSASGGYLQIQKGPWFLARWALTSNSLTVAATKTKDGTYSNPASIWLPATEKEFAHKLATTSSFDPGITIEPIDWSHTMTIAKTTGTAPANVKVTVDNSSSKPGKIKVTGDALDNASRTAQDRVKYTITIAATSPAKTRATSVIWIRYYDPACLTTTALTKYADNSALKPSSTATISTISPLPTFTANADCKKSMYYKASWDRTGTDLTAVTKAVTYTGLTDSLNDAKVNYDKTHAAATSSLY